MATSTVAAIRASSTAVAIVATVFKIKIKRVISNNAAMTSNFMQAFLQETSTKPTFLAL